MEKNYNDLFNNKTYTLRFYHTNLTIEGYEELIENEILSINDINKLIIDYPDLNFQILNKSKIVYVSKHRFNQR